MTERELERQLRSWYRAEVHDDHQAAPRKLREAVGAIPASVAPDRRPIGRRTGFTLLAAATLLVAGGALASGTDLFRWTALVVPSPSYPAFEAPATPTPTRNPTSAAETTPVPTPSGKLAAGFSWTRGPTSIMPSADVPSTLETATLLEDGRVLVTASCTTAAEIYDPATDTFTRTGALGVTRAFKTATRLLDGRVLFVGGYDCGPALQDHTLTSAEVYDPNTGVFTATGPMHDRRQFHTATLLTDGRVLVAGGFRASEPATSSIILASVRTAETSASVLDTAEVYDPATGTFSRTGSMSTFRDHHTATLLADGRVLVAGGGGEAYASSTSADIYDPATGRFTKTGSMHTGRWLHTATLLDDGRVLILGGRSPRDSVYRSGELYDPDTGTFRNAGSMVEGRQQHTATILRDGRVLIVGGYWSDGSYGQVLTSSEMYEPATGTFSTIGSIGTPREDHVATSLADGRVLIVGGIDIGQVGAVPVLFGLLYQP